jgi:hypothetical protein
MLSSVGGSLKSLNDVFRRLDEVANRVARDGATGDVNERLVELTRIRAQVRANVASVRLEEERLGTLLDTFV